MPGRHPVVLTPSCSLARSLSLLQLICWKKGQASRIHNHAQSHCWLSVLSGGVEELQFSTGTSPVETRAAVEPRLPGVLSATRWVHLYLEMGDWVGEWVDGCPTGNRHGGRGGS